MGRILSTNNWEIIFKVTENKLRFLKNTYQDDDKETLNYVLLHERNPLGTDLTRSESSYTLPYRMKGHMKTSDSSDHLVSIKNIAGILYLLEVKYNITEKWKSHFDFMDTMKALNVLMACPATFHNQKLNDWKFELDDVMDAIYWNKKLINAGVQELVHIETHETVDVNIIWNEWYRDYYIPYIWKYMKVEEPA